MSTYTPNLDLLKKNPTTEGSDLFNVGTMLNDNWDKIDSYVALVAASIAPAYSASSAYAVGAWCTHGGKLWQCATAIGAGGEAWNEAHWTAVTAAELLAALATSVEGKQDELTFDNTPTADSANPVKSGGVYTALGAKADQSALDTFVRPNLLDNWYFVGGGSQQGGGQFPINQRGSTSYSGIGYTFDRWEATGGDTTVAIESDGVTLTCPTRYAGIYQYLEQPPTGKQCALSILSTEGLSWQLFTFPSSGTATVVYLTDFYVEIGTNYVAVLRRVTGSASLKIHALKLELGGTQTLAHQENGVWVLNEIPDYNEQMLRCNEGLGQYAQVEYGSYTGTGTYGSTNANSLTFPFVPQLVLIKRQSNSQYSIVAANGLSSVYSDYSTSYANNLTWDGMTLEWYNASSAARQLNELGATYCYVAIG